jgi:hypothetical protein
VIIGFSALENIASECCMTGKGVWIGEVKKSSRIEAECESRTQSGGSNSSREDVNGGLSVRETRLPAMVSESQLYPEEEEAVSVCELGRKVERRGSTDFRRLVNVGKMRRQIHRFSRGNEVQQDPGQAV